VWRVAELERPIFADPSGRRARLMSAVGLSMMMTTVAAIVIVVTGAIGFSDLQPPLRVTHALAQTIHRPGWEAVVLERERPTGPRAIAVRLAPDTTARSGDRG
jgi:hypothetical protein